MKRIKLVLALAAVLVAMLVAFSAPALANDHRDSDRWDRWDRNWSWDNDWRDDDCEWEWEEEGGFWAWGPWGWYWQPWGFWELDC